MLSKLKKQGNLEQYDRIIQDQLQQGIVKPTGDEVKEREFYIPHKQVIYESAETTKMHIVYVACQPTQMPRLLPLIDCH